MSRAELSVLAALALGALLLRLVLLTDRELWLDEAFSVLVARAHGLGAALRLLAADNYPPLYFLALRGWVALFGAGEAAVRIPSTIAGVALVPLVWALVREGGRTSRSQVGGGTGARLLAALLAALSPLALHYSVEARPYTLLWALAAAAVLALQRLARRRRTRDLTAASVLTALACGVHYFGVLLAPVWGLAVGLARGRRGRVTVAGLAAVLPVAAWALLVAERPAGASAWLTWLRSGPLEALAGSLAAMSLGHFPLHLRTLGAVAPDGALAWAVGLWFGVPVAAGVARCLASSRLSARGWLLPVGALGPAVILAVVSLVHPMYLVGRYELIGYPAWIALWALGLETGIRTLAGRGGGGTNGRWVQAAWVAAVWVTLAGVGLLVGLYLWASPAPWTMQTIARRISEPVAGEPQEAVVVAVGLVRAPLEVQLRRLREPPALLSFPADIARHPGWMDLSSYDSKELQREAEKLAERVGPRPLCVVAWVDARGEPMEPGLIHALAEALLGTGHRIERRETLQDTAVWFLVSASSQQEQPGSGVP